MKKLFILIMPLLIAALVIPVAAFAQDEAGEITIRTLPIEYYAADKNGVKVLYRGCLLYTSPSPRDRTRSRMPSSA